MFRVRYFITFLVNKMLVIIYDSRKTLNVLTNDTVNSEGALMKSLT
jgi:hypothetical protein